MATEKKTAKTNNKTARSCSSKKSDGATAKSTRSTRACSSKKGN